jgi:Fe-S cluster assembly protein SufD
LFGLVNDVLAADGVVIDVAPGVQIAQPVRIVYRTSAGVQAHARVLVRLGAEAKLAVIEQAEGSDTCFSTYFSEYALGAGASLEHYRFALQTGSAMCVGGCHFSLADKSALNSTLVGFGSDLSRLDVDVIHAGEFAHAKMNAIYLLDGSELFDLHTTIEHAKPNGTTVENVRGIVADKAKAVFNGRIHIHRDAQKTLAELNNRNLLLSENAEINTKPELEIYADDVRCAHGATVAEIDKGALYYLQTRGISRSAAQVMLNFGFINELVDDMPNAALADWLRPLLRDRFARMDVK